MFDCYSFKWATQGSSCFLGKKFLVSFFCFCLFFLGVVMWFLEQETAIMCLVHVIRAVPKHYFWEACFKKLDFKKNKSYFWSDFVFLWNIKKLWKVWISYISKNFFQMLFFCFSFREKTMFIHTHTFLFLVKKNMFRKNKLLKQI